MKKEVQKLCLMAMKGILSVGISLGVLAPGSVFGEFYVAGMGGYVVPNGFNNTQFEFAPDDGHTFDLKLENSAMGGGKIGYYFPSWEWVGVGIETEGVFAWPNLKEQTVMGSGCQCYLFTAKREIQVITWGINALARYPGKRIQPYVGAGLGVFFASESIQGYPLSTDNWVPGLNFLAGVRGFVTDHLALFAEYKYNRATFTLGSLKGDYSANIAAGGLSFHFNVDPL
ncbi:MAG: outer membrane beta-barrel protein [Nitrospirales bacterium]|nr:outer membrane beta-barrel protein [Nitrospirales bacterium]